MIIQTLSHYEHLNQIYADLIETCVKQLGYESILPDILRELKHHINSLDQQRPANAGAASKENPNMKFYSQFLVELGERLTVYLRKDLTLIIDYLGMLSFLYLLLAIFLQTDKNKNIPKVCWDWTNSVPFGKFFGGCQHHRNYFSSNLRLICQFCRRRVIFDAQFRVVHIRRDHNQRPEQ
jgi:hypothetical protein